MRMRVSLGRRLRRISPRIVPWLSVTFLVFLVATPLALFIWLLFFTEVFTVQAVTVVDAREHTTVAARKIVERELGAMPLAQNIFFVQTEIIETAVKNELPQVRTAHVQRKLPGTIKTIIQEKTPVLLLLSNGKYYFVDEAGLPYEEARLETLPEVVLPIIKNDDQGVTVTLGVPALAPDFVMFLQVVQDELPQVVGSEVAEIHVPSLSAKEVHVVLSTNWTIKFDIERRAEAQLAVLRQLLETKITREERDKMEYIDLRVPNRIYYK